MDREWEMRVEGKSEEIYWVDSPWRNTKTRNRPRLHQANISPTPMGEKVDYLSLSLATMMSTDTDTYTDSSWSRHLRSQYGACPLQHLTGRETLRWGGLEGARWLS